MIKKEFSKSTPLISIVIPAYNEINNFKRNVLEDVNQYLKNQTYHYEVILVNDGSTDKTLKALQGFAKKHPGFKVLDIPHGGKVAAVTAGVLQALGRYILFTDFDQSTPIETMEKVLQKFDQGADIVIGERSGKDLKRSFLQDLRSKVFNLLVQLIALPGIKDSQCGFKAFKNELGKNLFRRLKVTHHTQKGGYMGAFDVELLYLARKLGYKIISLPVSWQYFESKRLSMSEPIKMLCDVIKVKMINWQGGYQIEGGEVKRKGLGYHLLPILLLLLISFPAIQDSLKPGYFALHDDMQTIRLLVMDKCFKDNQIPCRWSEDLGYGYGYPLFNYYPPFPYYLGQLFRFTGIAFVDIVKVLVVLNFLVSGLTMYLLAKEFWGRWGGFLSGLFYIYAPYHAVDTYVRGAINESWAIAFFPAVFWAIYKTVTTNQWKYVPPLAVFTSFLMLSHNPMLMIFAPAALVWALFWLWQTRHLKTLLKLIASSFWAVGLAAFFTLPVIFEQKYAHVETLVIGYFNYLAHFATVNQLFLSRFWGYGESRFGPIDDISFQIGYLHWGLALISLGLALYYSRKNQSVSWMIMLILGLTVFYTFMTHQRSSFIWSVLTPLLYLQFPWRFLSLSIFFTSFLAGSIVVLVDLIRPRVIKIALFTSLITATIFLYKDYFHWREHYPEVSDQVKFSGKLWQLQITSGIFDYLPIWAPLPPALPPVGDTQLLSGQGKIEKVFKNSTKQEYKVDMQTNGIFQINTFYFPGWQYFVNGQQVEVDPKKDKELGRPQINLDIGQSDIVAKFTDTPIRLIGNKLSLFSWVIVLSVLSRFLLKKFRKVIE